jgi:hypothetical protein
MKIKTFGVLFALVLIFSLVTTVPLPAGASTPPPLTVVGQAPPAGATGVGVLVQPYIVFSNPMNATTITSTSVQLRLSASGAAVAATVTLAGDGVIAIIMPSSPLAFNTAYYLYVTTSVKDIYGNALATAYGSTSTQFTTTTLPLA